MANIEIFPTTPQHMLELRTTLREEDASEICKFGLPIRRALYRSFRNSIFTRTALVDGKVAASWGLCGVLLGESGHPWLLTGTECDKVSPLTFARIYKREVQEMLTHFPVLENWVDNGYYKSIRLLSLIGFTLDDPMPIKGLKSQALFRKFWLRSENWA